MRTGGLDPHSRGVEVALRALNSRERSERELRDFLHRRQVEPAVIEDVVAAVVAEGLVDDAGYARRFAEDRRLLDGWGNERIAGDLERRGIQRELIDEALVGHGAEEELAVAVELLDRRFPVPFDSDRERDRPGGFSSGAATTPSWPTRRSERMSAVWWKRRRPS